MKSLFTEILRHPSLIARPPVLVDVGASGDLPSDWHDLARHSIGVVFDADTRDFAAGESTSGGYKRLYSLNRLVAAQPADSASFFLTRSPYCSSSLEPNSEALEPWAFRELFEVNRTVSMPAVSLITALQAVSLDYIDWFKADSQGTDLRIFSSLPRNIIDNTIAAEFEPGIIDAYQGEDKLHHLMNFMDSRPFWVTSMKVKGSQRIHKEDLANLPSMTRQHVGAFLKSSPGWCEISYINHFGREELDLRAHLLGWIFSTIKGEHGFAMYVARRGEARFQEPLFQELYSQSRRRIAAGPLKITRKILNKLRRSLSK